MKSVVKQILDPLGIPVVYHTFHEPQNPPFITLIGAGQNNVEADNTYYTSENTYTVEYYFAEKNEELERQIEEAFLENGRMYEKSEDIYIQEEEISVIYYTI